MKWNSNGQLISHTSND
ncbi:hypothetical protein DBZ36_15980 [Alginatibacterium sediminis]|uniref:Uncharacterized protein n=1 Tax=Alginatibacterium sediminis TaxID=2164068 RepID=A0A420E9M7_9ALTE|nr:hypothetical protein DBZ36_15980 [Alginatibacterium sediminis]